MAMAHRSKSGAAPGRRPKTSRYDPPVRASLVGIRGEGFIGVEVQVALDGKA
jgi:hypothetical protein